MIYTGKTIRQQRGDVARSANCCSPLISFPSKPSPTAHTEQRDYPDEWIESLKRWNRLDFEVLVPGHGKIGRKGPRTLVSRLSQDLRAAVLEHVKQGRSLKKPSRPYGFRKYEQWQRCTDWLPENVEGMYRYLSQTKTTKIP